MQISPSQGTANMNQSTGCPSTTTGVDSNQNSIQKRSISHPTFENPLTVPPITVDLNLQGLRALPQKSSPLQTNRASSGYRASSGSSSPPKTLPSKVHEPSCPPEIAAPHNSTSSQTPPPPSNQHTNTNPNLHHHLIPKTKPGPRGLLQ